MNSILRALAISALFNIMIVFAVLAIHETGHYLVGMYVGCESAKVVLFDTSQEGPYTELQCFNVTNGLLPYAGSMLFTIGFGLLFLFFENAPERNLFWIVLGLSILTAGLDIVEITKIDILYNVFVVSGLALTAFGEIAFGISFIKEEL